MTRSGESGVGRSLSKRSLLPLGNKRNVYYQGGLRLDGASKDVIVHQT